MYSAQCTLIFEKSWKFQISMKIVPFKRICNNFKPQTTLNNQNDQSQAQQDLTIKVLIRVQRAMQCIHETTIPYTDFGHDTIVSLFSHLSKRGAHLRYY